MRTDETMPLQAAVSRPDAVERLKELAEAAARRGDTTGSLAFYDTLLPMLAQEAGSEWADALRRVGTLHRTRGDTGEAEWWYRRSLEESERMGYRNGVAHATNWLAVIAVRRGEMDSAQQQFHTAAELALQTQDSRLLSMIEQNLGVLASIRGDLEGALGRYESALAACRHLGDAEMLASILNNIGLLNTQLSRWSQAADAYLEAIDVAREAGLQALVNAIELNVAELDGAREKWEAVATVGRETARIARGQNSRWLEAEALRISGMSARRQGLLDEAERTLLRAAVLSSDCQDRLLEAQVSRELGETYEAAGRYTESRAAFAQALDLFRHVGAARDCAALETRMDGGGAVR